MLVLVDPTLSVVLPLALGITLSPLPIVVAVLILQSPHARPTGLAFLAGWVLGIAGVVAAATVLAGALPEPSASATRLLKTALGLLLAALAAAVWHRRPRRHTERSAPPAWLAVTDAMTARHAFVVGVLLTAVNPKNLLLAAAGGVGVGLADLPVAATALGLALFTAVAAASVVVVVGVHLVAVTATTPLLQALRSRLVDHGAGIATAVLLTLAVAAGVDAL